MEDLESTTRYVTWSLHNKNRAGLRHFLDSFAGTDNSTPTTIIGNTQATKLPDSKSGNSIVVDSSCSGQSQTITEMRLIFHGIKEHFLVSTELKFNCFLLMPVVDKLPALLREELDSVFGDDLDSIFNITQLKCSLGQRKRDLEIELKQVQRLKEKFREIYEALNFQKI
ncbi:P-loop containing nucleoside triphosphate hydrolases superfamily protein [Rhynchospora pubera]|uniref:P-loop containing nucleoside triphosphate hydrolases superfamily protein n=1 Tax=Rhynchospora pubera TaxID=906938 RepID=A0AAV8HUZ0_9POAL|nr:P-loop containing nucleoside triphosphate hydrolases superfamily protein [Rhynchospora pubera]